MLNFADIANKPLAEIERPPLPPVGHYIWQVLRLPTIETSKDEAWDIVRFQVQAVEATDDVDPDEMEAYGKLENIRNTVTFMFNKQDETEFARTEYNLRRFLEEHVRCADSTMSLNEAINGSVNGRFLGNIILKADKNDKELFHANIGRIAPLD